MPSTSPLTPLTPDAEGATTASHAVERIKDHLNRHRTQQSIRLVVDDDTDALVVPRQAVELLARILVHMAAGEGVSIVPDHAELTTQQAADLLNVSRPYLIKMLETGEIEYRHVGKHRRISFANLLAYQRADDQRRRNAADELSALTQELDLT